MQQRCRISWGRTALGTAVLWLGLCGGVHAAGGTFGVSAQVLPRAVVDAALARFPAPPGARRMLRLANGESFVHAGDAPGAAGFYRTALASQGYRLVHASRDGLAQEWRSAEATLHLTLAEAPGSTPLTRIVVEVGARG